MLWVSPLWNIPQLSAYLQNLAWLPRSPKCAHEGNAGWRGEFFITNATQHTQLENSAAGLNDKFRVNANHCVNDPNFPFCVWTTEVVFLPHSMLAGVSRAACPQYRESLKVMLGYDMVSYLLLHLKTHTQE